MRYRPAAMMDAIDLADRTAELVAQWRVANTKGALEALLEHLHAFAPNSLELLGQHGNPTLDELRIAYES
jgi:hypothetical protein